MYEAPLSSGGEWADKQLDPKFLQPALDSLQKSRGLQSDTPGYLEALIAYYRRDFDSAQKLAAEAVKASPWLYEGLKLQCDMQLQQALTERDSGKDRRWPPNRQERERWLRRIKVGRIRLLSSSAHRSRCSSMNSATSTSGT